MGGFRKKHERRAKDRHLPNFHRVSENLYRGGQPSAEGIRQLAALGVRTIINFRDARPGLRRERQAAEEHGLLFINLHLSNWFAARDEEIHKIIEVIMNPERQPVFIHCKRGADRTGTVVAVYRMLHEGWTARDARREAKRHGIGWWQVWMKDYIKAYYRRMQAKKD